jgi:hypothetical protein
MNNSIFVCAGAGERWRAETSSSDMCMDIFRESLFLLQRQQIIRLSFYDRFRCSDRLTWNGKPESLSLFQYIYVRSPNDGYLVY